MKINRKLYASFIIVMMVGGCASSKGPKENTGMVVGGLLGGVLGNQIGDGDGQKIATVLGAIVGTVVGGNIGRSMDESDRHKVAHSLETTRTGESTSWNNPDSRSHYKVTPTRTYENIGTPCREYEIEGYIDGRKEMIYGTACRQSDGNWEVVK